MGKEKYCSVSDSLKADITFHVILNGEEVKLLSRLQRDGSCVSGDMAAPPNHPARSLFGDFGDRRTVPLFPKKIADGA